MVVYRVFPVFGIALLMEFDVARLAVRRERNDTHGQPCPAIVGKCKRCNLMIHQKCGVAIADVEIIAHEAAFALIKWCVVEFLKSGFVNLE